MVLGDIKDSINQINKNNVFVSPQYLKPETVDFEPKYKKKGRSKAGNIEKRKQQVREDALTKQVKDFKIKQLQKGQGKEVRFLVKIFNQTFTAHILFNTSLEL